MLRADDDWGCSRVYYQLANTQRARNTSLKNTYYFEVVFSHLHRRTLVRDQEPCIDGMANSLHTCRQTRCPHVNIILIRILDKRQVRSPYSMTHTTTTKHQQSGHNSGAKGKTANFSRAWCSMVIATFAIRVCISLYVRDLLIGTSLELSLLRKTSLLLQRTYYLLLYVEC